MWLWAKGGGGGLNFHSDRHGSPAEVATCQIQVLILLPPKVENGKEGVGGKQAELPLWGEVSL